MLRRGFSTATAAAVQTSVPLPGALLRTTPAPLLGSAGFAKGRFEAKDLKRHFDHSLLDAPDSQGNRFRRSGSLSKDPLSGVWRVGPFEQPSTTFPSHLGNNVEQRLYKPLTMTFASEAGFQSLLETFIDTVGPGFRKVHCHQIKVMATDDETTLAHEGVHRDGYDVVAVACVRRHCITGARNTLRHHHHDTTPFFDDVLQEGDVLLFDDHKFCHDVSPMLPVSGLRPYDTTAYRDIIVLHATEHE